MDDLRSQDRGPNPLVLDIESATVDNDTFRTTLWTGGRLQLTVMSIDPGSDVGLEVHHDRDQFLRVERGAARVQMGPAKNDLSFDEQVGEDWAILVPAGSWHNITNTGEGPLKLYSLYAPPEHPHGTVHATKSDARSDEHG